MSTKSDKTKEKLLSSMRRTKAGTTETTTSPAESTTETPSTGKMPAKAKPATKAKAPVEAKSPTKATASDAYQSGRRIWPD